MTKSKKPLKPEVIRSKVERLRKLFVKAKEQRDAAEAKGREIDLRIRELQDKCPHANTREVPYINGPGVSYCKECVDCGLEDVRK